MATMATTENTKSKYRVKYKLSENYALSDVLYNKQFSLSQKGLIAIAFICFPINARVFCAEDFKAFGNDDLDTVTSDLAVLEKCKIISAVG